MAADVHSLVENTDNEDLACSLAIDNRVSFAGQGQITGLYPFDPSSSPFTGGNQATHFPQVDV
jgi:hypothetical protein